MPRIQTALTRLLGIRVPVVCAPMAGAAGGLLAAGVTRGGGFGFVAAVRPLLAPYEHPANSTYTGPPTSLAPPLRTLPRPHLPLPPRLGSPPVRSLHLLHWTRANCSQTGSESDSSSGASKALTATPLSLRLSSRPSSTPGPLRSGWRSAPSSTPGLGGLGRWRRSGGWSG